jgi:hypothetical protein
LNNLGLFMFLDDFGHIYRAKNFVKSKPPNVSKNFKEKFQRHSKICNAWKFLSNLRTCMLPNKGWFCFWLLPTIPSVISHEMEYVGKTTLDLNQEDFYLFEN